MAGYVEYRTAEENEGDVTGDADYGTGLKVHLERVYEAVTSEVHHIESNLNGGQEISKISKKILAKGEQYVTVKSEKLQYFE